MIKAWLREILFIENGVCPVCGRILFKTDAFLCAACEGDLPRVVEKTCLRCGRPLDSEVAEICTNCGHSSHFVFDGGYCWLHYTRGGKAMIQSLKFKHRPRLGLWIGKQMARGLLEMPWLTAIDFVVPVPLHPVRLEERGYNQSGLIAEGIAGALAIPLEAGVLSRIRDTRHQTGLDKKERQINLKEAFLAESAAVSGKRILLIDDVSTTGSTFLACTAALKEAGAHGVYTAVCAARG